MNLDCSARETLRVLINLRNLIILPQLSLCKRQISCQYHRIQILQHQLVNGLRHPELVTSAGPKRLVMTSLLILSLVSLHSVVA